MKRFAILAGFGAVLGLGAIGHAQELETFDSPDTLQYAGGNFYWTAQYASWATGTPGTTFATNPTNWTVSSTSGYGSAYKSIYAEDTVQAVDASASNALRLDATLVSGLAGLIVHVQDGYGDQRIYDLGFGLDGNAADDQGNLAAGETITQGAATNELILTIPYGSYTSQTEARTPAPGGFDYGSIVNFNVEDDPGSTPTYTLALNDLSAVTASTPEPASLSLLGLGGLFLARRRKH